MSLALWAIVLSAALILVLLGVATGWVADLDAEAAHRRRLSKRSGLGGGGGGSGIGGGESVGTDPLSMAVGLDIITGGWDE